MLQFKPSLVRNHPRHEGNFYKPLKVKSRVYFKPSLVKRKPVYRTARVSKDFRKIDWKAQGDRGIYRAIAHDDPRRFSNIVRSDEFRKLMDKAYASPIGHAIGYVGGQKVMAVAGTRNLTDWANNVRGLYKDTHSSVADALSRKATDYNVKAVVGHSRGGTYVSGMKGRFQKAGVDAAMVIANRRDRGMMNVYQKQPFDQFLAWKGKKNYAVPWRGKFHSVYNKPYDTVLFK